MFAGGLAKWGKLAWNDSWMAARTRKALLSLTADQWVAKGECCATRQEARHCQRKLAEFGLCQPAQTFSSNYLPSQPDGLMIPVVWGTAGKKFFWGGLAESSSQKRAAVSGEAAEHLLSSDLTSKLLIGTVPGKYPLIFCVCSKYEPTD